jgi:hypothetical protein
MRWILVVFVFLAACRHPPLAYTLRLEGRTQVLAPPPSRPEIKKARNHPKQKSGCDVDAESYSVSWHGNTARVAVKAESYYAPAAEQPKGDTSGGVSVKETGPRVYIDPITQLEKFRDALAAREDSGCFRDDEGAHLRQAMVETFPFPPQVATYLRFGTYLRTGFIDLMPDFVLRVVNPGHPDPELSFYQMTRVPSDNRVRLVLVTGAGKALAAPEDPAFFRYLYWTGGSTHNFRTTILGVPERSMLAEATASFLADPEGYCVKPGDRIFCQSIAVSVGMNAGFYVRINGKDAFVRLGGQLGEALGENRNGLRLVGRTQPIPQNIIVRRMFHGKLIPVNADSAATLLSLIAMPGDEITSSP